MKYLFLFLKRIRELHALQQCPSVFSDRLIGFLVVRTSLSLRLAPRILQVPLIQFFCETDSNRNFLCRIAHLSMCDTLIKYEDG